MIAKRCVVAAVGAALFLSFAFVAASAEDAAPEPIAGIGPAGPVAELAGEFSFTEGPAANVAGDVYFSDIPATKVYKVLPDNQVEVFRGESGRANGMMFNAAGELVTCEMTGRVTAVDPATGAVRELASQFEGNRFNAPNDLVVDATGGVYFTDPDFGAPQPNPQPTMGVYYIAPDRGVSRVVAGLPRPNGVILSPDEKTLYVIPTGQAEMMAYPVLAPGKLGEGRVFCKLQQAENQTNGGGDGLTVDTAGNVYITSALGLQVFNPAGELLGILTFPKQPANVAFGGADHKTLYVTARNSVYVVPMEAQGHVFPGGPPK